jgi:hypothetical protein
LFQIQESKRVFEVRDTSPLMLWRCRLALGGCYEKNRMWFCVWFDVDGDGGASMGSKPWSDPATKPEAEPWSDPAAKP